MQLTIELNNYYTLTQKLSTILFHQVHLLGFLNRCRCFNMLCRFFSFTIAYISFEHSVAFECYILITRVISLCLIPGVPKIPLGTGPCKQKASMHPREAAVVQVGCTHVKPYPSPHRCQTIEAERCGDRYLAPIVICAFLH